MFDKPRAQSRPPPQVMKAINVPRDDERVRREGGQGPASEDGLYPPYRVYINQKSGGFLCVLSGNTQIGRGKLTYQAGERATWTVAKN